MTNSLHTLRASGEVMSVDSLQVQFTYLYLHSASFNVTHIVYRLPFWVATSVGDGNVKQNWDD